MSGSWFDPKSLNTALQAAASMATEALKEDPEKEELLQELHDLKKAYLSLKNQMQATQRGKQQVQHAGQEERNKDDYDDGTLNNMESHNHERIMQLQIQLEQQEQNQYHQGEIIHQKDLEIQQLEMRLGQVQQQWEEKHGEVTGNLARVKALASDKIKRLLAQNQELQNERDALAASSTKPTAPSASDAQVQSDLVVSSIPGTATLVQTEPIDTTEKSTEPDYLLEMHSKEQESKKEAEISELVRVNDLLGAQVTELQSRIDELEILQLDNQTHKESAEAQRNILKNQVNDLQHQLSLAEQEIESANSQTYHWKQECDRLEKLVSATTTRSKTPTPALPTTTPSSPTQTNKELAEAKDSLKQKTLLLQEMEITHQTTISSLQAKLLESQSAVEESQARLVEVELLVGEREEQMNLVKIQFEEFKQTVEMEKISRTEEGAEYGDGQVVDVLKSQILEYQGTLETQQTQLSSISAELASVKEERNGLVDKLQQFKLAVGQKLQQEMEEGDRVRALLAQVQQEKEGLEEQIVLLGQEVATMQQEQQEAQIQRQAKEAQLEEEKQKQQNGVGANDTQAEMEYLQSKTLDLVSQVQKSEAEVTRLRTYLIELEESHTQETLALTSTISEYKLQITTLEGEREELVTLREMAEDGLRGGEGELLEMKSQLTLMGEERLRLMGKVEQEGLVVKNLQNVLAQFEAAKEQDIEDALIFLKKSLAESEAACVKYKESLEKAHKRMVSLEADAVDAKPLKKELAEKTALIGQLRHDIVQLQSHLSEAMRYMKQGSSEDSVDRKLVANLIVGLMVAKYGDPKRFEILTLIASILKLSEDEKAKVGLIRQAGASLSPRGSSSNINPQISPAENFMDMWISFLQTETTKDKALSPNASASNLPAEQSSVNSAPVLQDPPPPPPKRQFSFF